MLHEPKLQRLMSNERGKQMKHSYIQTAEETKNIQKN